MTGEHLDDEALSAAVDGEASDAERAHLAACPSCGSRLAAFGQVAAAVAGAPPFPTPAPDQVERAIDRAIEAGDRSAGTARPPRRLGTGPRRTIAVLAVAAVAAGLLAIGGVTNILHRSGGGQVASSAVAGRSTAVPGAASPSAAVPPNAPSSEAPSSAASVAAPAAGVATTVPPPAATPTTLAPGPNPSGQYSTVPPSAYLGNFVDAQSLTVALRAVLQARLPGTGPPAAAPTAGPDCVAAAVAIAHLPAGTAPILTAPLTYQGTPAQVLAFAVTAPPGRVEIVVRASDCGALAVLHA